MEGTIKEHIIHPTAVIHPDAKLLGNQIEIGAYSVVGKGVTLNSGCKISSHCVVEGYTVLGKNNKLYPFCVIGSSPQHAKFSGEKSKLIIGDNNTIREHVTMHPGTEIGTKLTKVGSNGLFKITA